MLPGRFPDGQKQLLAAEELGTAAVHGLFEFSSGMAMLMLVMS